MTRQQTSLALLASAVVVAAVAGCSSAHPVATNVPSPVVTAASPETTDPTTTPTTDPATGSGCAPAGSGIPKGATTKPTLDLDGDGRPDTEWAIGLTQPQPHGDMFRYGFTTASGDTSYVDYGIAGGSEPTELFADVTGRGTIAMLISYSRGAALYAISGCTLVPVTNPQGQQYTFDIAQTGRGTGVGCSTVAGAAGQTLVGLNLVADSNGNPTAVTRTQVIIEGTHAHNGLTDTVPTTSRTSPAAESADTVSCGKLTAAKDGVAPDPM